MARRRKIEAAGGVCVRVVAVAAALFVVAVTGAAAGEGGVAAPVWGPPVPSGTIGADASEVAELLTVDLNGDGLRDVVVGPNNTSLGNQVVPVAPVFLLNRGNGRFMDATRQLFVGAPPLIEWDRELLSADFNGDGRRRDFEVKTRSVCIVPANGSSSSNS
jgi:VCBS repeat protein